MGIKNNLLKPISYNLTPNLTVNLTVHPKQLRYSSHFLLSKSKQYCGVSIYLAGDGAGNGSAPSDRISSSVGLRSASGLYMQLSGSFSPVSC